MRMDRTFVFQYWYRNPSNILIFKLIYLNLLCLVNTPNLLSCVIKRPLPGCSPIASLVATQLLPHHNGSDKEAANNKWSCPVFCNTTEKHIKGEQKKRGRLKLWNALNKKKCGDLGSWKLHNLFIWSDYQVGEVTAS